GGRGHGRGGRVGGRGRGRGRGDGGSPDATAPVEASRGDPQDRAEEVEVAEGLGAADAELTAMLKRALGIGVGIGADADAAGRAEVAALALADADVSVDVDVGASVDDEKVGGGISSRARAAAARARARASAAAAAAEIQTQTFASTEKTEDEGLNPAAASSPGGGAESPASATSAPPKDLGRAAAPAVVGGFEKRNERRTTKKSEVEPRTMADDDAVARQGNKENVCNRAEVTGVESANESKSSTSIASKADAADDATAARPKTKTKKKNRRKKNAKANPPRKKSATSVRKASSSEPREPAATASIGTKPEEEVALRADAPAFRPAPRQDQTDGSGAVHRGHEAGRPSHAPREIVDVLDSLSLSVASVRGQDREKSTVAAAALDRKQFAPSNEGATNSDDVAPPQSEVVAVSVGKEACQQQRQQAQQPETEKERMQRLLREEREKSAAAAERKRGRKSRRREQRLREEEAEKARRANHWSDKLAQEDETVDLISRLIVAEFLRQNKDLGLAEEQILADPNASQAVASEGRRVHEVLYGSLACRVRLAGSGREDLDGRQGTLRRWDADRGRFCVGLDSKKGPDSDVHYLSPEILEVVPGAARSKDPRSRTQSRCAVDIDGLFDAGDGGVGCRFALEESDVSRLRAATSIDAGLAAFCLDRNDTDRRRRLEVEEQLRQEEEYRRQEEEDRKRRKERKARAQAAAEHAREERRRREVERVRAAFERSRAKFDGLEKLLKMQLRVKFLRAMLSGMSPEDFFEMEGLDPEDFDEEDQEFFGNNFEYVEDEAEKELRQEKDREMAAILGLEPDADERTLKITYRKLALKYHPDKWRDTSDHGLTQEESLEHFKSIQNAYDHLMSKFDEEEEEG
ncbi:hypothetical protein ACHAWF_007749, partial [Thalassiosira exigua]